MDRLEGCRVFIHRISSSDDRFKSIEFRNGLNILVAEKASDAGQGDSRNSTGKTSLVKLLRYLLGGGLDKRLNKPALHDHVVALTVELPYHGVEQVTVVRRPVKPSTKIQIDGWTEMDAGQPVPVEDWKIAQQRSLFHVPEGVARPTSGQIWGQFIRTYFDSPQKTFSNEAEWESGARLGFLLGLSAEVLNMAGDLDRLKRQREAINLVNKEDALVGFSLDEANIRSELASARNERNEAADQLRDFTVDEQYADHQVMANDLSRQIRDTNDRLLALDRRKSEVAEAISFETNAQTTSGGPPELQRIYEEAGVVLPALVKRRFEEVAAFHRSVVENRRHYLDEEIKLLESEILTATTTRTKLDTERAEVLQLLRDSVAVDTLIDAQRSIARLDALVGDLERKLETASRYNEADNTIKLKRAESVATLRAEVSEQSSQLDGPIAMFRRLGDEIYTDRLSSLLVSASAQGTLKVRPEISGDGSTGIQGVETFLLDIVTLIQGLALGRGPRLLVHDSHNFDATDHRQVASCLNIGARLAEEFGFQYIVTMNSDFLASVESEGAFDSSKYILDTRLSDATEDGGLFGFRFE